MVSEIGARTEQQDACDKFYDPKTGNYLVVVCDGVGGSRSGGEASKLVISSAAELWKVREGVFADPKADLLSLARVAHGRIKDLAGPGEKRPPASTIVALYVSGNTAHWIHAGDSRLYRFRAGSLVGRTRDHSVVQILVDQGEVAEKDMGTHPDQGRLLQSLGTQDYRDPSYGTSLIDEQDAFLLCTDGFWERTPVERMASVLGTTPAQLPAMLTKAVQMAVQANGPKGDNVTAAVLAYPALPSSVVPPVPFGEKKIPFLPAIILLAGLGLLTFAFIRFYEPSNSGVVADNKKGAAGNPAATTPSTQTIQPPPPATPAKPEPQPRNTDSLPKREESPTPVPTPNVIPGGVAKIGENPETPPVVDIPDPVPGVAATPELAQGAVPFANSQSMRFFQVDYPGKKLLFAETETTIWQFGGSDHSTGPASELPVSKIYFDVAQKFADELTAREREKQTLPEGWRYRLPINLEWKHAAEGGAKKFPNIWGPGARPPDFGNIGSSAVTTVGKMKDEATPFHLRDMCGNVEEMVSVGDAAYCAVLGGSFHSPEIPKLDVNAPQFLKRNENDKSKELEPQEWRGFRLVLAQEPDPASQKKSPPPTVSPPSSQKTPPVSPPQSHQGEGKSPKPNQEPNPMKPKKWTNLWGLFPWF